MKSYQYFILCLRTYYKKIESQKNTGLIEHTATTLQRNNSILRETLCTVMYNTVMLLHTDHTINAG